MAVLYGGRSAEHEISLISARGVLEHLDRTRYEPLPVGITREGGWLDSRDSALLLRGGRPEGLGGSPRLPEGVDCVFPVLHGPYGEDGTLQGWLELMNVPFVGSECAGAATAMDKTLTKRALRDASIPVLPWSDVQDREFHADPAGIAARVAQERGLPCFVKPTRLGSSVGITRATTLAELQSGLEEALHHGPWALVEPAWEAREFEIAVLDGNPPIVSVPGEIRSGDWYDYDAKYLAGTAELLIPAPDLQPRMVEHFQEMALRAFQVLRLKGLARVDFLLGKKNGRPALNEVNTIPGFTPISMYPKLMEHMGISFSRLCDRLIELAMSEHRSRTGRAPAKPAVSPVERTAEQS